MNQGLKVAGAFLFALMFALSGTTALAQEGTPEAVEDGGMPAHQGSRTGNGFGTVVR